MTLRNAILALLFAVSPSVFAQEAGLSSTAEECVPGFTCNAYCPSATAGNTFKQLNCRCPKNKAKTDCAPKGDCKLYDGLDRPVVPEVLKPCKCQKITTAPTPLVSAGE